MSLIQQQAKFWLKALIRIVDVINTQYSNETADLLKNGPFGAYGYLVGGDAGARKWSAVDGLMQGADAVGHAQEARNNIEDMYAAQPSVPYTDQPANHTAAVQTPTTDNTPPITDEPQTTPVTLNTSAEPIKTNTGNVVKEIKENENKTIKAEINAPEKPTVQTPEKHNFTAGSSFEKRHIAVKVTTSSRVENRNTIGIPGVNYKQDIADINAGLAEEINSPTEGKYFILKNGNRYYLTGNVLKPLAGGNYKELSRKDFTILGLLNTEGESSKQLAAQLEKNIITQEDINKIKKLREDYGILGKAKNN